MVNLKYFGNGIVWKVNGYVFKNGEDLVEELGDMYVVIFVDMFMWVDVFDCFDEEKMEIISQYFWEIMEIFGLDLNDDFLNGMLRWVVKMFVKEIFGGLNFEFKFVIFLFENKFGYWQMLVEKGIQV